MRVFFSRLSSTLVLWGVMILTIVLQNPHLYVGVACFFGIAPEHVPGFKAAFGVPEEYAPIGAVTVGYRADDVPPQPPETEARRRAAAEVVHRGRW